MAEARAGEQLCVRDDRDDQRVASCQLPDASIGGGVKGIVTVEEARDHDRVEECYHSSRRAVTLRPSSPPVARLPEYRSTISSTLVSTTRPAPSDSTRNTSPAANPAPRNAAAGMVTWCLEEIRLRPARLLFTFSAIGKG